MSRRRSGIKEETDNDEEIVMRWDKNRIAIAVVLVVLIIFGGLYVLSLLSQNPKVLGEKTTPDKPQIKLPDEKDVDKIINGAKQNLSEINAKNVIDSQPKLKKIIDDLTHLTGSSMSAKNLICDSLCK